MHTRTLHCILLAVLAVASPSASAQLTPVSEDIILAEPVRSGALSDPLVGALPGGHYFAGWLRVLFNGPSEATLRGRFLGADGAFLSEEQDLRMGPPFGDISSFAGDIRRDTGEIGITWLQPRPEGCLVGGLRLHDAAGPAHGLAPIAIGGFCPLIPPKIGLLPGSKMAILVQRGFFTEDRVEFFQVEANGAAPPPLLLHPEDGLPTPSSTQVESDLAVTPGGTAVAVYRHTGGSAPEGIYAQWLPPTPGAPGVRTLVVEGSDQDIAFPKVAVTGPDGAIVVIWRRFTSAEPQLWGRRFGSNGQPRGAAFPILPPPVQSVMSHSVAADGYGRFAVTWVEAAFPDALVPSHIYVRLFDPSAEPLTDPVPVRDFSGLSPGASIAFSTEGTLLMVWEENLPTFELTLLARIYAVPPPSGCAPAGNSLCLQGDRFQVEVEWRDFQGGTGAGQVVPTLSDSSGLFWFFHPDNWDLMVKVLDACAFSGHYWVFSAATTNVEYTLTVTDTFSGEVRTYQNPLGVSAPAVTDTTAFATCP